MHAQSEVYDIPPIDSLECVVEGRLSLPGAVIELHDYNFHTPQHARFTSPRSFLDLALSPRPGTPRGGYADAPGLPYQALGEILFVPADKTLETEWGAGRQRSICCGFDGKRPDDELFDLLQLEACLDVRSPLVRDAMLRLAREIESPGFCSEILANAIWIEIAVELGRYLRRAGAHAEDHAGALSPTQLRAINELIQQPGKLPTVSDLARLCGLSTRHFFRMFRATTGMTLSNYAAEKRIERAKLLLGTPRSAIKEIAWQCGFETSAAFSAAFRKAVGVTPKDYRGALIH